VNADSYVTIVDVDSEGGVNLLFPNNYQNRNFHGDGFIQANETVMIPDSVKPGNQAGFYWDYSPPKGTDTIRVFTSTDMQTAQMIRDRIASLQASSEKTPATLRTRSVATGMRSLRQLLSSVAARGIITVADTTSHVPGEVQSEPGQSLTSMPPDSSTELSTPNISIPAPSGGQNSSMASATALADWAATSITITISE
jgi:hypothetical protein